MVKVKKDLTGMVFGKWTVLYQAEDIVTPNGTHVAAWCCKCECGTIRDVRGADLTNGSSTSCGCIHQPNLIGMTFGRLTVIARVDDYVDKWGKHTSQWLCECSCENHTICIVRGPSLTSKKHPTRSCGCLRKEVASDKRKQQQTHGMSKTKIYKVWGSMKARCNNPNNKFYYRYGARGIKVCEEWNNSFDAFFQWAVTSGYKEGLSIERLDNDKGYEPNNCTWISLKDQATNKGIFSNNKSGVTGVSWNTKEQMWESDIGVDYKTIHLGLFTDKEDAIKARLEAELKYFGVERASRRHLFEQYGIEYNPKDKIKGGESNE